MVTDNQLCQNRLRKGPLAQVVLTLASLLTNR